MATPIGLARKTLGTGALFSFSVGASAPMTVLAGGVTATFASTGVIAVPVAFAALALALVPFTVAYVSVARHLVHAGPLYAYLAHAFGPARGLIAAPLTLLAYNAIQVSLYGLFGSLASRTIGGAWWVWAIVAWAGVAVLGVRRVTLNAGLLTVLLVAEVAMVLVFDVAALSHPADGTPDLAPLDPAGLTAGDAGGVFALSMAAFVGYESIAAYGEEARDHTALARATFGSLALLGVLYTLSSWALANATGPRHVVDASRASGASLITAFVRTHYGPVVGSVAVVLLVTSVFAAMLSLHHTVARYVFVLSREQVLPSWARRIGSGGRAGAPVGGSLAQSVIGLAVITVAAVSGVDPVGVLFTRASAIAAVAIMMLMVATCLAVLRFYRTGGGGHESVWTRVVAPAAGAIAVGVVLTATLGSLVRSAGTPLWPLLATVVGAVGVGWIWAGVISRHRPQAMPRVGWGEPEPLAELEPHFASVDV